MQQAIKACYLELLPMLLERQVVICDLIALRALNLEPSNYKLFLTFHNMTP